ncbi:MAG: DUF1801 domain-containing protein [Candidatus Limnocylindrales bacterium]
MSERIPPEAFLADYPAPLSEIAQQLRAVVQEAVPEAIEAVRLGWRLIGYDLPLGRKTAFFAWVWPEADAGHVHLGFPHGVLMDDPDRLLRGAGVTKQARWVTLRPGDLVDGSSLTGLVLEATRVARMSRGERYARALDRELGPPGEA